jgi:hypothetical protein
MDMDDFKDAESLFRHNVEAWSDPAEYMLAEDEPLPDAELTWWHLHPFEVAVFGIDPDLYPRLLEAHRWYSGAIAETAHDEYFCFAEAEQQRWARFVATANGERVFDRDKCLAFMHEAAGLPLRQCAAMLAKADAMGLRGATVWFRDEVEA